MKSKLVYIIIIISLLLVLFLLLIVLSVHGAATVKVNKMKSTYY